MAGQVWYSGNKDLVEEQPPETLTGKMVPWAAALLAGLATLGTAETHTRYKRAQEDALPDNPAAGPNPDLASPASKARYVRARKAAIQERLDKGLDSNVTADEIERWKLIFKAEDEEAARNPDSMTGKGWELLADPTSAEELGVQPVAPKRTMSSLAPYQCIIPDDVRVTLVSEKYSDLL